MTTVKFFFCIVLASIILPNCSGECGDSHKQKVTAGGWECNYGPRLWDFKVVGTVLGSIFPPTSSLASAVMTEELQKQAASATGALKDLGLDAIKELVTKFIKTGSVDHKGDGCTGVKGRILRQNCKQCIKIFRKKLCMNSEGFHRWALCIRRKCQEPPAENPGRGSRSRGGRGRGRLQMRRFQLEH